MKIPLNEFEQHIDETILKRGLSYFKNHRVEAPDELTSGVYEFKVQGTEEYTVTLHLKNDVVTDFSCDCPFDSGTGSQTCGCNTLFHATGKARHQSFV